MDSYFFFSQQIILDSLSLSSSVIFALTRSPVLGEKEVVLIIEDFILDLLNLTKTSVVETKVTILLKILFISIVA